MLSPVDIAKLNPLRSPRWRYDRVVKAVQKPGFLFRRSTGDDYPIRLYHRYLTRGAAAHGDNRQLELLRQEYPDAALVHELYFSRSIELRQILEARLLTDESFAQIANRMGLGESAVRLYSDLFFDVRDRMQATLWVLKIILGSPETRCKFNEDGTLTDEQRGLLYRLFAYYGGPLVLDAMVAGISGVTLPQRPDELPAWFDSALGQIIRTTATGAVHFLEINRGNAMQLIKLAIPRKSRKGDASGPVGDDLNIRIAKMLNELEPVVLARNSRA
jgi:hypothetical protein